MNAFCCKHVVLQQTTEFKVSDSKMKFIILGPVLNGPSIGIYSPTSLFWRVH